MLQYVAVFKGLLSLGIVAVCCRALLASCCLSKELRLTHRHRKDGLFVYETLECVAVCECVAVLKGFLSRKKCVTSPGIETETKRRRNDFSTSDTFLSTQEALMHCNTLQHKSDAEKCVTRQKLRQRQRGAERRFLDK